MEPSLDVTGDASGVTPRQTSASAGKPATPSTSGAASALQVLRVKKLNVKKIIIVSTPVLFFCKFF
jgi:hypothetical protein